MKKINKKTVLKVTGIVAAIIGIIGVIRYLSPEEYTEEVLPDEREDDEDDYADYDAEDDLGW